MFRLLGDPSNLITDHDIKVFETRDIFVDCREKVIIGQNVLLGFGIKIISQSHDIHDWRIVKPKPVKIGKDAFIGSFSLLYNCEIGEGAIVACGAVVRNMTVPPNAIVEGNPAKIIGYK